MTAEEPQQSARALYIMVGGFLGAGKTTAVDRFARELTERGQRVGLITNDQSSGLVDTAILRSRGFAVEEIAGGCFCCRFDSLQEAASKLTADTRPEVFLAEPVGSCTDLLATVSYPLRRIYGDRFRISPLSVLVDPKRAARILGLAEGRAFSPKVVYVYKKQLEEADIIVVNKSDSVDAEARERLTEALAQEFPQADVISMSAQDRTGLDAWYDLVLARELSVRPTMEVDYDLYAEGEALLGWLNATVTVTAASPFDGNELLLRLTEALRGAVDAAGAEIAHLKMTLDAGGPLGQLSVVSVVSSDGTPDLRESVLEQVPGGQLILNLRAEMAPEQLSELVAEVIAAENGSSSGLELRVDHQEHFRPGRPVPTHRIVDGDAGSKGAAAAS